MYKNFIKFAAMLLLLTSSVSCKNILTSSTWSNIDSGFDNDDGGANGNSPPPAISLSSPSIVNMKNYDVVTFDVVYTNVQSVNLSVADITLTGDTEGCVVSVQNGTSLTPTVSLTGCIHLNGSVGISIAPNTATDQFGNQSPASNSESVDVTNSYFIAVYNIDSATNSLTLDLPLKSGFNYNFTVDWGDSTPISTVTAHNDSDKTHTYASNGTYTVTIKGLCESWGLFTVYADPETNYQKQIIRVDDLGDMGWRDLSYAFYKAVNLTNVDGGVTSQVENMAHMFHSANAFTGGSGISTWDVSSVTNMARTFDDCLFNQDISGWATDNVTDMNNMFLNNSVFDQYIGGWNVSNVTNMSRMFRHATAFNQNIGGWNVSSVTDMSEMFSNASAFNQDIGGWIVSNVTNMRRMFLNASAFNQNIGGWDTSSVTDMRVMFRNAAAFNQNISSWPVGSVSTCNNFAAGTSAAWIAAHKPALPPACL